MIDIYPDSARQEYAISNTRDPVTVLAVGYPGDLA
jgi:hypothetical protein